jgi:hypothetical protein
MLAGAVLVPAADVFSEVNVNRARLLGFQIDLEEEFVPDAVFVQVVELVEQHPAVRFGAQLVAALNIEDRIRRGGTRCSLRVDYGDHHFVQVGHREPFALDNYRSIFDLQVRGIGDFEFDALLRSEISLRVPRVILGTECTGAQSGQQQGEQMLGFHLFQAFMSVR